MGVSTRTVRARGFRAMGGRFDTYHFAATTQECEGLLTALPLCKEEYASALVAGKFDVLVCDELRHGLGRRSFRKIISHLERAVESTMLVVALNSKIKYSGPTISSRATRRRF